MAIIIGADIVPIKPNYSLFSNGQKVELIGQDLVNILEKADYRIFNLEAPLTDTESPIAKHGPVLRSPKGCVTGIKAMGIDLLSLANNHIMDHDSQGLFSTIHTLDNAGISHVGAGIDIDEARKPFYFEINDKNFGIYSCAEHEFSVAGQNRPGANPFDPMESLDHVNQMKKQCDYVIVLYHGGKENYRYPSPGLQTTCRKFVEKGANLVVCQHSHCIGCKEEYGNGTIVYGQGNFLFTKRKNEFWNTGLLIEIGDCGEISYIPFEQRDEGIRLANKEKGNELLESFELRSEQIVQPGFVEQKYREYSNDITSYYILDFLGIQRNFIFRGINKLSRQRLRKYLLKQIRNKRGLMLRNFIECESHRELILKGLEKNDI